MVQVKPWHRDAIREMVLADSIRLGTGRCLPLEELAAVIAKHDAAREGAHETLLRGGERGVGYVGSVNEPQHKARELAEQIRKALARVGVVIASLDERHIEALVSPLVEEVTRWYNAYQHEKDAYITLFGRLRNAEAERDEARAENDELSQGVKDLKAERDALKHGGKP